MADGLTVMWFFGCLLVAAAGTTAASGAGGGTRCRAALSRSPCKVLHLNFELQFFFAVVPFISGHMLYQATRAL